ncbi:HIT family protein [Streptomyces virginiae]|uniref:HIT family protein n=1 Tax=Streptomyces virginiae TaxID=1961 RepID=UPI002F9083D0
MTDRRPRPAPRAEPRTQESGAPLREQGRPATQTVDHLHLHVVPRQEGDILPLPWTPQHAARAAEQGTATP